MPVVKILNGSIELNVTEDGLPSAPPILLLHGITSYSGTWDWLVPDLAEHFRVLGLDFRGHGNSGRAADQYFSSGYISDAVTVLERVAGQPAIVIGHSLGGATTAALAQRHPELLRAAIMEDPPLGLGGSGKPALEGTSLLTSFKLMRESVPRLQASGITCHRSSCARTRRSPMRSLRLNLQAHSPISHRQPRCLWSRVQAISYTTSWHLATHSVARRSISSTDTA